MARKLAALSHTHKHGVQRRRLGKEISSRSEQVDPIAAWEDCWNDNNHRPFYLIISRAFSAQQLWVRKWTHFFFLISTDTTKVPLTFAPKSLPHHLSTLQYMNHISENKIISTLNLTYNKRYILIQIASHINYYYYIIINIRLSFTKLLINFENVCHEFLKYRMTRVILYWNMSVAKSFVITTLHVHKKRLLRVTSTRGHISARIYGYTTTIVIC